MNDDLHAAHARRLADNEPFTIREALNLFSSKSETAALAASLSLISNRVAELPSRAELKTHWDAELERSKRLEDRVKEDRDTNKQALEKIDGKVDTLLADRLPKWVLPAVAILAAVIIPLIVLLVNHYWK